MQFFVLMSSIIYSYRPDLIPYDDLKTDTREAKLGNLELAFT